MTAEDRKELRGQLLSAAVFVKEHDADHVFLSETNSLHLASRMLLELRDLYAGHGWEYASEKEALDLAIVYLAQVFSTIFPGYSFHQVL